MSAYKAKSSRSVKDDLDARPPFKHNLEKYSRKTAAQEMLEKIEKSRKQRNVTRKTTLEVTYDSYDGKFKKTNNQQKDAISKEQQLYQKQIKATKEDKQNNYNLYTQFIATALLDELQIEFQRAQLLENVFDKEERNRLVEQFQEERNEFQNFIARQREDFDQYERVRANQLELLEDGATKREREERKERKQQKERLAQIQYEMEEALKKSQEAIKQREVKQREIKNRLKQQ